ncbi:MAG TPA: hypothetical protein VFG19_08740 [Geobacteraceae bacterium]|nr:hypothetical protein [Geobacteraceae bacterium]
MNTQGPAKDYTETDLTIHIFSVSAALVGVCLTVIGLFQISHRLSHVKSFGEKLLAVDALIFLSSCLLAYFSLQMRRTCRQHSLERLAEEIFFAGLVMMAGICFLIVYEFV